MYEIGSKVKIVGLDAIGIITGYDITNKYAHITYSFLDDEERIINYGCFHIARVKVF